MTLMIGFSDPPYHTRIRAIARRSLSPAFFDRLRPKIQRIVAELLVDMVANRRVDIIAEMALPLPEIAICEMLGVHIEDRALIKEWSDRFVGLLGTGCELSSPWRRLLSLLLE